LETTAPEFPKNRVNGQTVEKDYNITTCMKHLAHLTSGPAWWPRVDSENGAPKTGAARAGKDGHAAVCPYQAGQGFGYERKE
jgi:hypothetical protein